MGRNILVVEDDKNISDLIHMYLVKEGFDVRIAGDGGKALEEFQKKEPDLILLDIWMPDTDGVSLLKELKVRNLLHCPVLMMSGHATIETAVEATKFGALACLEKPISMQKLLESVRHGLEVCDRIRAMAKYRPDQPEEKPIPVVPIPTMPEPVKEELPVFNVRGTDITIDFTSTLKDVRETTERAYLRALMNYENNQMTRVAKRAGLERTHLYRKLKALGIPIPRHTDKPEDDVENAE